MPQDRSRDAQRHRGRAQSRRSRRSRGARSRTSSKARAPSSCPVSTSHPGPRSKPGAHKSKSAAQLLSRRRRPAAGSRRRGHRSPLSPPRRAVLQHRRCSPCHQRRRWAARGCSRPGRRPRRPGATADRPPSPRGASVGKAWRCCPPARPCRPRRRCDGRRRATRLYCLPAFSICFASSAWRRSRPRVNGTALWRPRSLLLFWHGRGPRSSCSPPRAAQAVWEQPRHPLRRRRHGRCGAWSA
mmetsp:Transcript_14509/g.41715  ORF Transcript_14509/g.41715 Transcript_14509/m.41715 type:complete len:242 (+) Transcript_14509:860-1585(+)